MDGKIILMRLYLIKRVCQPRLLKLLKIIFVDKNILKQNFAQYPDSLPPNDTILLGIINAGKKIIHIKTKPK